MKKNISKYLDKLIKEPFQIQEFLRESEDIRNDICPSIGKEIGQFLKFLVEITKSKQILEIGTSIGYSTLWIASAGKNVNIDTIEINENLINEAKSNINKANIKNKINFILGNAEIIICSLKKQYDLIFVDSSTKSYFGLFEKCLNNLKINGIIIFDDILFSYKAKRKKQRELMKEFIKKIINSNRIKISILNICDGLLLCKKIK